MGKGNRNRNQKASEALAVATRKNAKKNKSMPTWAGTAIVLVALVALVLAVTFIVLQTRGTFLRMRVVAESENYEITVPMMSYLLYTQYEDVVAKNREYAESFKEMLGDSYSASMFPISGGEKGDNLDISKGLREQIYERKTAADGSTIEKTWFDYFAEVARSKAQQMLVMCEKAKAIGMSLDEDDIATIDAQISMIELYAQIYGYTTSGYLSSMYGDGVSTKDVRNMLEISQLSGKYAALKLEEFENGVDSDRINNHYNDNKELYDVYMDFLGYTFTATFEPSKKTDADEKAAENEANKAKYEAEQKKYADRIDQLSKVTTVDEFKSLLSQFIREDALELEIEAALKDKAEGEELTDLEIAECNNRADKTLLEAMKAASKENVKESAATSVDSEIKKWLFETKEEGEGDEKIKVFVRKVNEIKDKKTETAVVTEGDKAYQKVTSSYAIYIVAGEHHRSTGLSVGHILFKSETFKDLTSTSKLSGVIKVLADEVLKEDGKVTAAGMAKKLLQKMEEEKLITKNTDTATGTEWYSIKADVFEEYGDAYTGDSNVTYHDVVLNQRVEEFENWMFAEGRHEGEITYPTAVDTEYGSHIMFFYGDSWEIAIKDELANSDYEQYCKDVLNEVKVEFNDNHWKRIAG
ncbi:MAG: hypothetical protein IJW22_03695 [Clostridia bacterium]|nr:hypothetical protein [Clostridia bacterium]